jgi:hypothetical protein
MEAFGDPYEEVHRWLDGLAFKEGKLDLNHRRHRHHAEGIKEIARMYGDKAAKAARQHILDDEGHIFTREEIQKIYPDCDELKTLDDAFGKKPLDIIKYNT